MRKSRRGRLGARALIIGIPVTAAAVPAAQALASSLAPASPTLASAPASETLRIHPQTHHLGYDGKLVVRGAAPAAEAGHRVALEFAAPGARRWRELSSTTVGAKGRFRLAGRLVRSGQVRVQDTAGEVLTPFVTSSPVPAGAASAPARVEVSGWMRVPNRQIGILAGRRIEVRGRLLPGVAGRKVKLQGLDGGWHTLTSARTGAAGRYTLHYRPGAAGQEQLRVRFGGDRLNGVTSARAGQLSVYRQAVASWYSDFGNTACGFHAQYGVANKTLPCGTKVAIRYGGRAVTATVDDRGPFIAGRTWDLNQNTARALGFAGVAVIWSSR